MHKNQTKNIATTILVLLIFLFNFVSIGAVLIDRLPDNSVIGLLPTVAQTRALTQSGNKIVGLDSTWMWSSDNGNSWTTGSEDQTFRGGSKVLVTPKNNWADVPLYVSGTYTGGQKVVKDGVLYECSYWITAPPPGDGWKVLSNTKPSAQYTFEFRQLSNAEILANLDAEAMRLRGLRKAFGYMPSWGVYDGHDLYDVTKINFDQYSHITYSFLKPINLDGNNPTIELDDAWAALGNVGLDNSGNLVAIIPKLRDLMKPLKDKFFVFSVGGWTYSEHEEFERATSTPAKTKAFAANIVKFMLDYEFDGIDIDWEFPKTNQYAQQFLDLHRELREQLTAQSLKDEKYYQLSTATTPNKDLVQYIKPAELVKYVDTVNYMAYDYNGGWQNETGHNAPLYEPAGGSVQPNFWIDVVAKEYLKQGVPANQLMMGVSFYARSWLEVPDQSVVAGLPGLKVLGKPPGELDGKWGNGSNPYYVMEDLLKNTSKGYKRYWDDKAKVPYIYSPKEKIFHTYDDVESISIKLQYIRDNGFAGSIIWDITGDTRPDKGTSGDTVLGNLVQDTVNEPVAVTDDARITTVSLPNASVNIDYSTVQGTQLSASGAGTKTWALVNAPSWLSIDSSGQLKGKPTQAATGVKFKASVVGSTGVKFEREYTIDVVSDDARITTMLVPDAIANVDYATIPGTKLAAEGGGTKTWALVNAPSWLSIDSSGQLKGKPTQAATGVKFKASVVGSTTGVKSEREYTIDIISRSASITTTDLPNATVGIDYGTVSGARIQATGAGVQFELSGSNPSWLSINSSTGVLRGIPSTSGNVTISVNAKGDDGIISSKSYQITVKSVKPKLETKTLPDGKMETNYSEMGAIIHATGDNIVYSISNAPSWLSIDSSTGKLSGMPDKQGTVSLTAIATNSAGNDSRVYSFDVKSTETTIPVEITTDTLPEGTVGLAYDAKILTNGIGVTLSISGNPSWLTLDKLSNRIGGTPTVASITNLTITATDTNGLTATKIFELNIVDYDMVNPPPPPPPITDEIRITTDTLPQAIVGANYDGIEGSRIMVDGGVVRFAVEGPNWLSIDSSTGQLSGIPIAEGKVNITVTILQPSSGETASKILELQIVPNSESANDQDSNSALGIALVVGGLIVAGGIGAGTFMLIKNKSGGTGTPSGGRGGSSVGTRSATSRAPTSARPGSTRSTTNTRSTTTRHNNSTHPPINRK
ncbi:MAG: putative Ig domain-containing protein [Clostridiales bacterium]|jgi:GH18 family chitinase|nr:putative Ig domain-containing protein [Clostridiales bacterium]